MRAVTTTTLSAILLIGLIGCKGKPTEPKEAVPENATRLRKLGDQLHIFHDEHNHLPKSREEFAKALADAKVEDDIQQMVQSDKFVIVYGGLTLKEITNSPVGMSGTVLAYEADVPDKGGLVMNCLLEVTNVSAEKFKKLPQAKK